MEKVTTSDRLKSIMKERGLKQTDIIRMAQPYCEQFRIKLGKSDLSQFVSGKVEPGNWKLTILALTLNVTEGWLMGFDVSRDRTMEERVRRYLNVKEERLLFAYRESDISMKTAFDNMADAVLGKDNP